ncbi:Maf-domain-containing protein [Lepidopterella palustris CBS 459.81]|uniref:Maf-domain-containing protein n=1 Tax=Lepidopterella palustris CBS 459.81 TaxID=1314670 RepID=A0A8E2EIC0_9PEZI|nr:Maf-domain-containing protein [Lepidopterella palustris CBS 459.81]
MSNSHTLTPADPPPSYEDASRPTSQPSSAPDSTNPLPSPMGQIPRPLTIRPLDLPALNKVRGKRVILASQSPRRRQLLASIGLRDIECIPSAFPENLPKSLSPFEYVLQTATNKAIEVYRREIDSEKGEPSLIIAADTVVVSHKGDILEKPKGQVEHIRMLTTLRDTGDHKVYTAVAVMAPLESAKDPGYNLETHVEETTVKFDSNVVTDALILSYVMTREGIDKAGGYGIQGTGSILVERIEGTYDNVVGLPLRATLQLIEKVMEPEDETEDEYTQSDDE